MQLSYCLAVDSQSEKEGLLRWRGRGKGSSLGSAQPALDNRCPFQDVAASRNKIRNRPTERQ
jgi:hypothetical protein